MTFDRHASGYSQAGPAIRVRKSRAVFVIVMIVALVASGVCRQWASNQRNASAVLGSGEGGSPLSRMNSFALGLLLGGLRGPLVMLLWTTSETQKQQKSLDDFDTKVEWIRLLQPEFDSVHIFQIWNKAYNISVLKASLNNKYLTILDALDYAQKVDRDRPDDINIVYAIGGVYFDKLGQSAEKKYYIDRVRQETLPHSPRQKLSRDDPAWRPLELDPMLDEHGNILPSLLAPTHTYLSDPKDPTDVYDGSTLQFLARYQPFPDGISPNALGFSYTKRAAMLRLLAHQHHSQLSDYVIDSRIPLDLSFWANEEMGRARKMEADAFGVAETAERSDLEVPKELPPAGTKAESARAILTHVQQVYALVAKIDQDAAVAYEKHIPRFQNNISTAESHLLEVTSQASLAAGDRDYLAALLADGSERTRLLGLAADGYTRAAHSYELYQYRYSLSDANAKLLFPPGYDRSNIASLDPSKYDAMLEGFRAMTFLPGEQNEFAADAVETDSYISRAQARLAQITDQLKH